MKNQIGNSRKIALALSGGGARGMAHIGVIRELLAQGYEITSIAGCSIGSVIGAMQAMGKLEAFADFLMKNGTDVVLEHLDFTLSDEGFIRGEKLLSRLQEFAPDCLIEDLPVKLRIVATDMNTGNAVVYDKGSVYRAVRASVAIPAVITAVHDAGYWLVDGGVVNPLPLDVLPVNPGDLLIAVNLYASPVFSQKREVAEEEMHQSVLEQMRARWEDLKSWRSNLVQSLFDDPERKMRYFTTLRLMSELASKRLAENSIRMYPVDVLIEIPIATCGLFSFDRTEELVALGGERTRAALFAFENKPVVHRRGLRASVLKILERFSIYPKKR